MPTDQDDIRKEIAERHASLNDGEKEKDTIRGIHDPKAAAAAMMALFQLMEQHDIDEVEIDLTVPRSEKGFELGMAMTPKGILIKRISIPS